MTEHNIIASFAAFFVCLIALVYKFIRIVKSDRSSDQIDNEETAFRMSLREETKSLREENCRLTREKLELLERAIKAESERDYLKVKCENCGYRLEEENDD